MPGVMYDSRRPYGKAKAKCIAMLKQLGIDADYCEPAKGHWRTSPYADVYRWEFSGTYKGIGIAGGCWETMTKCAKAERLELNLEESEVWPVITNK